MGMGWRFNEKIFEYLQPLLPGEYPVINAGELKWLCLRKVDPKTVAFRKT
jgi:hypothetical protein